MVLLKRKGQFHPHIGRRHETNASEVIVIAAGRVWNGPLKSSPAAIEPLGYGRAADDHENCFDKDVQIPIFKVLR